MDILITYFGLFLYIWGHHLNVDIFYYITFRFCLLFNYFFHKKITYSEAFQRIFLMNSIILHNNDEALRLILLMDVYSIMPFNTNPWIQKIIYLYTRVYRHFLIMYSWKQMDPYILFFNLGLFLTNFYIFTSNFLKIRPNP